MKAATEAARAGGGPPPLVVVGIGTAGAGLGALGGGIAANVAAWTRADLSADGKSTPLTRAQYAEAESQSRAGLVVGVAGAVTLALGVGLTVVGFVTGGPPPVAVVPTFGASPDGVAFGVSGRF